MADTRGIRAGRAFVELGVSDAITAGLKKARAALAGFGSALQTIGRQFAAVSAAVIAPLAGAVKTFSDQGDALAKMSRRTGISVEALSELGFAAEQSGADLETLEAGVRKMQRTLTDAAGGSKSAQDALAALGLTAGQVTQLAPEQQFKTLAAALARIPDPSRRAALAMELFGRSGTRLLPLIQEGPAGIEALQAQARRLGLTVSTETAKSAEVLNDTLNILWRVIKQGVFVIGAALAPTVIRLSNYVTRVVVAVNDWVRANGSVIVTVAKIAAIVGGMGVALLATGLIFSGLAQAVGGALAVFGALKFVLASVAAGLSFLVSPVGIALAAVTALGGVVLSETGVMGEAIQWLQRQFASLSDAVGPVIAGIRDALAAGDVPLAGRILWLGLRVAWETGIAALRAVWSRGIRFFLETWHGLWAGLQVIADDTLGFLLSGWTETVAFFTSAWGRFTTFVSDTWLTIANLLTKTWNTLKGVFDSTFDAAAANLQADIALVDKLGQNSTNLQRKLAEIEAQRRGEREAEDQRSLQRRIEIAKQLVEAERRLAAGSADEGLEAAKAELDKAKRELDEAIKAAAHRRRDVRADEPFPARGGADIDDLVGQLKQVGVRGPAGASVTGAFSAFALRGIAGNDSRADRIARATEDTAKNTSRLISETRQARPRFT